MQALVETIKAWQLHPVVDHFTVALVVVGILVDLLGSLMQSRTWPRTSAVTLMVVGAAASWGSQVTGGWEARRVWDGVQGPALDILKRHAFLGEWLPWAILVLALWRVGIQFVGFIAETRPIYLLIALVAGGVLVYQGRLGGALVYNYGVGTALMPATAATATPQASATATPAEPSSIPTVFNPNATPTPEVTATPEVSPSSVAPSTTSGATESPTPSATPTPMVSPLEPGGTPVNPPGGEAAPGASPAETPAPKNL
jgi:uncharacterized membrane protein